MEFIQGRGLAAEEVYTFAARVCDDQPDRDNERFTVQCQNKLAKCTPAGR